ncbi:hypothetical protein Tco_1509322 [Tanacetum coccineum]
MVAFLSKPAESEGFEQIVDFLNANPINGELHALVDGKKIIITESTVRRDLQLEDAEGVDCLSNATIFEQLTLMGMVKNLENVSGKFLMYPRFVQVFLDQQLDDMSIHNRIYVASSHTKKVFANMRRVGKDFSGRVTPLFPTMMVQAQQEQGEDNVIDEAVYKELDDSLVRAATTASSLEAEQDSGNINKTRSKATLNEPNPQGTGSGSGPRRQDTMGDTIAQTRFENVSKTSNDSLLAGVNTPRSDDDSMKLKELMEFCTKLQQRVLDLENTKTAQAQEIISLKLRVKKLEKKGGSRTHKLKRLYKVGRSARIISSDEASLGDQEDASKQGRKINDIDKDAEIILVDETQGRYGDDLMFDTSDLAGEKIFVVEQGVPNSKKNDVVSTAGVATTVSAAATTVPITPEEITLAQALEELKTAKPKVKGIVFKEPVESTTTTTVSSQQPSQVKVQDKGKGKMVEPEKPMKKKELIRLDEEIASKLQAEFDEEVRLAREKAKKEEEANIVSWDNVQAMIDADYQMAQQMQAEEQEKLSIEEKSKLFVQLLEARKKHFAAMRAQEKRNKPPTKAQKRKTMSTYLKNMAGYKHNQLKNKSFDDIQKLFDKAIKRVNTFVDMDTELVEGSEVRVEGSETRAEGSSKRTGEELEQENAKKQKVDDDKETTELKNLIEVMPDEEEVALDAIPLAVNHMLKSFDREDLETLYKLVKAKYGSTRPVEDLDLVLYGDLKTMFEPHVEDNVWKNQSDYRVLDWKLYDSCGVHSLRKQNVHIHMLVEKRYPLTAPTITDMLNRKLQADH